MQYLDFEQKKLVDKHDDVRHYSNMSNILTMLKILKLSKYHLPYEAYMENMLAKGWP